MRWLVTWVFSDCCTKQPPHACASFAVVVVKAIRGMETNKTGKCFMGNLLNTKERPSEPSRPPETGGVPSSKNGLQRAEGPRRLRRRSKPRPASDAAAANVTGLATFPSIAQPPPAKSALPLPPVPDELDKVPPDELMPPTPDE